MRRNRPRSDKLEPQRNSGSSSSVLWRQLWQPGWHPRGGSVLFELPPNMSENATTQYNSSSNQTSQNSSAVPSPGTSQGACSQGGTLSPGPPYFCSFEPPDPSEKAEYERVEGWLDDHPYFCHDYFVRKAPRQIVDSWLVAHANPQTVIHDNNSSPTSPGSKPGSGASTPVRKISAHEFEKSGLLRPMLTTVDGTPTFLSLPLLPSEGAASSLSGGSGRPARKSRQELESLNEKELIFELVKDICNDLDVRSLCHKILQNVSILTNADRCSLFLVQGDKGSSSRYLISQLFDVSVHSTIEQMVEKEEIRISWGTGIVGYVAKFGKAVNIPDCYEDCRFSADVDHKTGYKTKSMLCMPIFDIEGEVMGVAQVINKSGDKGDVFELSDEKVFSQYLQFCGIGLRNAQLYERSQLENKRNQVLLDLARMVFEEQSTIEHVVYRIMTHTQSLLQCERCQVLLVEESTQGTFSRVFDLESNDLTTVHLEPRTSPFEGRFPINIGITGYVATTGETVNIHDAYSDDRFDPSVDEGSNFRHSSILCMPIRNAERKIIGVSQLINKINNPPFNKNDEDLFEAFAIFCGMGLFNTQMYEQAIKAMAKQRVTLEVLSYHAAAPIEEAERLRNMTIGSTQAYHLQDLKFNDFSLEDDDMLKACIRMFLDLDLVERFRIDYLVLCRWLHSVRKNYRQVTYHNWRHAFNVGQMMFAILTNTQLWRVLGELETLALMVACLCHDLDHRGTNNSFQIKSSSPLAQLYSTSTMEHHHFDQSVMILNSQGNQILSQLSTEEFAKVVHHLEESILATDLAVYFRRRGAFFKLVESEQFCWKNDEHRLLLRSMLMTACDVAAITKPWEIQRVVAELVASEFFQQGDIEKEELNMQPIDMMDREKKDQLPIMQVRFIDAICVPVYDAFSKVSDKLKPLLTGVNGNRSQWMKLVEESSPKGE